MTYKDIEMLNQSMVNTGNAFARARAQDAEDDYRKRALAEAAKRSQMDYELQTRRMDDAVSEDKRRFDQNNQPRIQAELSSDDGTSMVFTGTPEQLDGMVAAAKAHGKNVKVNNKRGFAAQFNIGGSQFSFYDQQAADKFAAGMKEKGIDVFDTKFSKGGGQRMTAVNAALEKAAEYRQAAAVAEDPEEAKRLTEFADISEAWAKKQTQFAPPAPGFTQTSVRQVKGDLGAPPMSLTNTVTRTPIVGSATAPAPATAKTKAELANQLAKEHPDWTREQIISAVNQTFAK